MTTVPTPTPEPTPPTPTPAPAPTPPPAPAATDKGYPENTPVAQMTTEQQAAYWQHQARKHEDRNNEWRTAAGGKTAAEIKADLEAAAELRRSQMNDAEKALEEARTAVRKEVAVEYGNKLVAAEFRAALAHVDKDRRDQIIGGLALSAYLTDAGDVDADKVQYYAAAIAPADKDTGRGRDYGNGPRAGTVKSGVAAGAAAFEARKKKSPTALNT